MNQDNQPFFWRSSLGLVLKVMLLSTLLAIAIKAIGPLLPVPPTTLSALAIVLLPPIVIGLQLLMNDSQPK